MANPLLPWGFAGLAHHLPIRNVRFPPLHVSGSGSQPSALARRLRGLAKAKLLLLLETRIHSQPLHLHLVLLNRLFPALLGKASTTKIPFFSTGVAELFQRPWDQRTRTGGMAAGFTD